MTVIVHRSTDTTPVRVRTEDGWKVEEIDTCIAPIVDGLQRTGVWTKYSCCGHGICPGSISLQDGRELVIAKNQDKAAALRAKIRK